MATTLKESIEAEQKISDKTKKNLRRASITIDAILKLNPSLGKTGPVVDENASVEAKKTSVEAKKAKAKKERRKSLSDMCKDSSGKLTNDYWSKLQSRFKVDDDEEEDKEKEMQKEEEDINKIYETSIAKKEIDVEEKVL